MQSIYEQKDKKTDSNLLITGKVGEAMNKKQ